MKIPFSIDYKPQIESGEYKVETRDGRAVRIICWDRVAKENTDADLNICVLVPEDNGESVYYYHQSGKKWVRDERFDLLIITPEPELSKFEKAVGLEIFDEPFEERHIKVIKEESAKLLDLAKKELVDDMQLQFDGEINEAYYRGRKEGKAEALRTRATELTENLDKSGLDTDSIPYHLIEFMCNLYTCQNWKEIEETAGLYVPRLKAATIKDLPRWKKAKENIELGSDDFCFTLDNDGKMAPYWDTEVEKGQYYITESDIENLSKEDQL